MDGTTPAVTHEKNVLGRYELLDLIARGPRGDTYLGIDRGGRAESLSDGRVVMKIMHLGATPEGWLEKQRKLALVYHPAIVPILEAGLDEEGRPYLVMPWRPSLPLHRWYLSEQGRQAPMEAMVALVVDLCEGLVAAHRSGLVHLGLKPGNVLIQQTEEGPAAVLVDFGLKPWPESMSYIAPELGGEGVGTILSDVYGVGMLLLRLLSAGDPAEGRLSFEASSEHLARIHDKWRGRLQTRIEGLPPVLTDTITRALDPDPSARHDSLEALARELRLGLYESAGRFSVPIEELEGQASSPYVDIRDGLMGNLIHERTDRGRSVLKFFLSHRDEGGTWMRSGAFFFAPRIVDTRSTYHSLNGAWAGAELSLYHARTATRGEERFYTHGEKTLPILEPYFLVPVTDVIKSQGCASRYLTDLRDSGNTGQALVVGRIVHNMLEAMALSADEASFETLFEATLRTSRLDVLAAGLSQDALEKLKRVTRAHYEQLCAIVTGAQGGLFEGASAEVKRFSGEYGLEGRIDLAFDDGESFRILELKTGRPYDEHAQQVRCYALLWDKVASSLGKQVVGELLYSKTGHIKPVDRQDVREERKIIQARNGIVSLHRHYAFGDTAFEPPYYLQQPSLCREGACRYRRERCAFQTLITGYGPNGHAKLVSRPGGVWGGTPARLVALARAYYERFVRFVESEYWSATMTLGKILRGDTLEERKKALKAVEGLEIAGVDTANLHVRFKGDGLQLLSPGQRIIAHRGDFHSGQIFTGRVEQIGQGEVVVYSSAAPTALRLPPSDWILDLHPTRIGHRERHRALFDFLRTRDQTRLSIILKREAPPVKGPPAWLSGLGHLNPQQQEAVTGAVMCEGAYLIQGPPGTGKTTVIAEIIRKLVDKGQRVLLAAATNTAVDNVLIRLLETGFEGFLRLGSARKDNNLHRRLVERGHAPERFFARSMATETTDLEVLSDTITSRLVIAATTHMAISSPVIEILERHAGCTRRSQPGLPMIFDMAILDEAGQITEPMALGAINRARRFVLVGDHQQLPPVVVSDRALSAHRAVEGTISPIEARLEEVSGVQGLDQSLFERLFGHLPSTMLEEQYRMHSALMAFSSRNFYGGRMRAAPEVSSLSLPVDRAALSDRPALLQKILSPEYPTVLVNLRGQEVMRQNKAEAQALLEILGALLGGLLGVRGAPRHFDPSQAASEIGVIAPFRGQVQLLRRMIAESLPEYTDQIEVDTVERFQGREKEIMLVSFVAAGRTSSFIANSRRLNVTLTRARTKLIVFGDLVSLSHTSALFRSLIEQPESQLVEWSGRKAPQVPADVL